MKKLNFIVLLIFMVGIFPSLSQSKDITEDIGNALSTGNSGVLARYFGKSLELVLLEKDEVFSKEQAQVIIDNFFKKNKPSGFTFQHKGGPEDARFAVCTLTSSTGNFRIYFLLKKLNEKSYIHLLRIEKEDK